MDDERAEPLFRTLPDERARAELFELYRPLANHLANRYVKRGIEVQDLEQVAAIGLLNAIDRFDPDFGSRFVSFAVPTITGELKKHFRDIGWGTRVPRRMKEISMLSRRANEELSQRLGRSPTIEEVADEIEVDVDDVVEAAALGSAYRPDALDAPLQGEDLTRKDRLGDEDGRVEMVVDLAALRPLLERQTERRRRIIELRFYEDLTQRQIAERIGISQMHVSRILSSTLEQLRVLMEV